MSDEPIPLYDGELSGAKIIPEQTSGGVCCPKVRGRRAYPRRHCKNVLVCFSPELPSGRVDHAACPVFNVSQSGIAVEYDEKLEPGVIGHISYRTISHWPVHVSCVVRRCVPLDNGRYLIGIKFDRKLRFEERSPARLGPGREIAPGIRTRKLRAPPDRNPPSPTKLAPPARSDGACDHSARTLNPAEDNHSPTS